MELKYADLQKLVMSEADMKAYNFTTDIPASRTTPYQEWIKRKQLVCMFCNSNIINGRSKRGPQCQQHPGRYPQGGPWTCCEQEKRLNKGCFKGSHHVYKFFHTADLHHAIPFEKTGEMANDSLDGKSVIAMDLEMVFTSLGVEVGRVTVVDFFSRETLYDKFVKPQGYLFDTHFAYSGITRDDVLNNIDAVSFEECQEELLNHIIFKDTIIVGHGLDNDLNALRLIHDKVIDTSFLFPRPGTRWDNRAKLNFKCKHSLKMLVEELLEKKIQDGTHDSYEDAIVCIDLVDAFLAGKKLAEITSEPKIQG